ncbi:hypothetical protein LOAG_16485 [Loa loa]|uniref:Uncharacterized protein n=1 Tax=Loa loa TaxID=7209 RepID=A0A1S0UM00_LOALO|nr:hypothetical protein LOAG_16485 [Loa loa]EJD76609.1 hypothetical protein LOAG_16485 [Loa loa]
MSQRHLSTYSWLQNGPCQGQHTFMITPVELGGAHQSSSCRKTEKFYNTLNMPPFEYCKGYTCSCLLP